MASRPEDQPPSQRVADAERRAQERRGRQRERIRPLGWILLVVILVTTATNHPAPGTGSATAVGILVVLCVYLVTLAAITSERGAHAHLPVQVASIAVIAASGVALAALQPKGATEVAASVAVWIAIMRLPRPVGAPLAIVTAVGLALALALTGSSAEAVIASVLLCGLLGAMAYFTREAGLNQDRTELLYAELQDAREAQAAAAAMAERGRIASELHDVLAHSLSGAALQLQGARMVAEREHAAPDLRKAIERASELVREGLLEARRAVGALRGEELPTVDQLGALVEAFRRDMGVEAELSVQGERRLLSVEANLALYRGAQEALTNVARYAPGCPTIVTLSYEHERTRLCVEDHVLAGAAASPAHTDGAAPAGLRGIGGGRGLAGMRERAERAGGTAQAGPTGKGWSVEIEVPA